MNKDDVLSVEDAGKTAGAPDQKKAARLASLTALRDRLAKATGPDREGDCLIAFAFTGDVQVSIKGPLRAPLPYMLSEAVERPSELRQIASDDSIDMIPRYTASLDAAVTLRPPDWRWEAGTSYEQSRAWAQMLSRDRREGYLVAAATPELALSLARVEYELSKEADHHG